MPNTKKGGYLLPVVYIQATILFLLIPLIFIVNRRSGKKLLKEMGVYEIFAIKYKEE